MIGRRRGSNASANAVLVRQQMQQCAPARAPGRAAADTGPNTLPAAAAFNGTAPWEGVPGTAPLGDMCCCVVLGSSCPTCGRAE